MVRGIQARLRDMDPSSEEYARHAAAGLAILHTMEGDDRATVGAQGDTTWEMVKDFIVDNAIGPTAPSAGMSALVAETPVGDSGLWIECNSMRADLMGTMGRYLDTHYPEAIHPDFLDTIDQQAMRCADAACLRLPR